MVAIDYRLILESGGALKLYEDEVQEGVFLENIVEGKSVFMTWNEVHELVSCLQKLATE